MARLKDNNKFRQNRYVYTRPRSVDTMQWEKRKKEKKNVWYGTPREFKPSTETKIPKKCIEKKNGNLKIYFSLLFFRSR